MIQNLDPKQALLFKRVNARILTQKAQVMRDGLLMTQAASMWDDVGEEETAEYCRKIATDWCLEDQRRNDGLLR